MSGNIYLSSILIVSLHVWEYISLQIFWSFLFKYFDRFSSNILIVSLQVFWSFLFKYFDRFSSSIRIFISSSLEYLSLGVSWSFSSSPEYLSLQVFWLFLFKSRIFISSSILDCSLQVSLIVLFKYPWLFSSSILDCSLQVFLIASLYVFNLYFSKYTDRFSSSIRIFIS